MGVGLGLKVPIPLAPKVRGPFVGIHDAWDVIVATCLKEQHADVGVFGHTTRNARPRSARSADDHVVLQLEVRTQLALIEANAFGELARRQARPENRALLSSGGIELSTHRWLSFPGATRGARVPFLIRCTICSLPRTNEVKTPTAAMTAQTMKVV